MTKQFWRKSFHLVLYSIRCFLVLTLVAVVISTLTECQPFDHYWQVVPDPGPKCRQGYAQLITMGVCDVITDILLVALPIPIIFLSAMPVKRKISLILLFALSLILVAITCYRVPTAINRKGAQQFRSLLASLEILASTGVANALVIGSFVRDRGLKKHKFKFSSVSDSNDQSSARRVTLTHHQWGSDADLASDLGIRLDPELHSPSQTNLARPSPTAQTRPHSSFRRGSINPDWAFPRSSASSDDAPSTMDDSMGSKGFNPDECSGANTLNPVNQNDSDALALHPTPSSQRKVSFFDIGGLLGPQPSRTGSQGSSSSPSITNTHNDLEAQNSHSGSRAFLHDVGGLTAPWIVEERRSGQVPPPPQPPPRARRGSLLKNPLNENDKPAGPTEGVSTRNPTSTTASSPLPHYQRESDVSGIVMEDENNRIELQDVGGLLSPLSRSTRRSDLSEK